MKKKKYLYHEEKKLVDAIGFNRISMLYWILLFQNESHVHRQQMIKNWIGKKFSSQLLFIVLDVTQCIELIHFWLNI